MGDNYVLSKCGPAHIWVPKRFRHKALIGFYGLLTVAHIPASPYDQLSKISPMSHYKDIRLQAHQEVQCCQASHMLPEFIQLFLCCQLLLCYLLPIVELNISFQNSVEERSSRIKGIQFLTDAIQKPNWLCRDARMFQLKYVD